MLNIKGILVIALVCLALAGPALAQPRPGGGMGRGMGPAFTTPRPSPRSRARWKSWKSCPAWGGRRHGDALPGRHPQDRSGQPHGAPGPGWYLGEKKFVVKVGDTVSATGSKVTLNNQPALIAREVKVNGTTLKLRDEQGLPVWHRLAPAAAWARVWGPAAVRAGSAPR